MKKAFIITLFFISLALNAHAVDASMEIVKKSVNLPKVSVGIANENLDKKLLKNIRTIISQDLQVSGHFDVVNEQYNLLFDERPNFLNARKDGVDLVVNLNIERSNFGGLLLYIKMYDVNSQRLVINKSFSTSKQERYPFLAHRTTIAVNDYLNAPKISWMDKFVIFSRYIDAKQSEIVIADYTLSYQKVVIKGGLNIFPKWADNSQESFYYTTYNREKPTLVKANLFTGQRTEIISSEGMIVCSDVSEDGKNLLLTMSPEGQPDIYLYNTLTRIKSKVTTYKGIDVSGSFVENDSKVVFVSDRLKYPNIFAKKIGSRGIERLVYHGRNNSSATTHENYIVYSSREGDNEFSKNSFNLYLISTQSDFIRRLTTNGRNQFPKFSSDGESVLFIKTYQGKSSLGILRLNYNKSFLFPLKSGKLQSIDW